MDRFYALLARCLGCLAVALLILAALATPEAGLADGGDNAPPAGCKSHDTCNDTCADRPVGMCADLTQRCKEATLAECDLCACQLETDGSACKCKK